MFDDKSEILQNLDNGLRDLEEIWRNSAVPDSLERVSWAPEKHLIYPPENGVSLIGSEVILESLKRIEGGRVGLLSNSTPAHRASNTGPDFCP